MALWVVMVLAGLSGAAVADRPTQLRHDAIVALVRAGDMEGMAGVIRPQELGRAAFDEVYERWIHSLGRARDSIPAYRRARLYEALAGTISQRSADGNEPLLQPSLPEPGLGALRQWIAGLGAASAVPERPLPVALPPRSLLLACDQAAAEALAGHSPEGELPDAALAPLVAAARARAVLAAIKSASTAPELTAACDRLLAELERGEKDYLQKVLVALSDGTLGRWLTRQAASRGATWITRQLLSRLGMVTAAGRATNIIGALFLGWDIAMTVTGESAAYPHARLAHFADQVRCGVAQRWEALRGELASSDAEVVVQFDSTTQAGLLLAAFVNREALAVQEAQAAAPVRLGSTATRKLANQAYLDGLARDWISGRALDRWVSVAAPTTSDLVPSPTPNAIP